MANSLPSDKLISSGNICVNVSHSQVGTVKLRRSETLGDFHISFSSKRCVLHELFNGLDLFLLNHIWPPK